MKDPSNTPPLRGVIPAIVSPCDVNDDFDAAAFSRLAEALIEEGVAGLYVCGLTGEGYQLAMEERREAVEIAVNICGTKAGVLAHVGTQDTRLSCRLAAHAAEAGAHGVAAIPPMARTFPEIERYYHELAAASAGLPVFIYHIPIYTKWEATFDQLARLSEIKGVCGIKFTDYNLMLMRRLTAIRRDFTLLYGRDEQFAAGIALGAHGGVGSTYNIFPRAYLAIQRAVKQGHFEDAFQIQSSITDAMILTEEYGLAACIEAVLVRVGMAKGIRRQPAIRLNKADTSAFLDRLRPILERLPSDAQTGCLKGF